MKKITIAFAFLLLSSIGTAQQSQIFKTTESFAVSVSGTSSLHDWECTVDTFSGQIAVIQDENELQNITAFSFSFKSENLKSGKSGMDKKMYDAIHSEKHPTISFKGKKVTLVSGKNAVFEGDFSINGTTKSLQMPVEINIENGSISLIGKKDILLTDFDIEPPKALLGTIKTGNEVTIHYNVTLSK
ncbi:YceI family protein [Flagellimonas alvinocaridis]|uniref:YceI family protein n=1 Tax=Flagellimonas alvinocaridis TaxID=2530200 RepID=A0A4S8RTR8_9FLAO|nr:YceI family protein [Allomuricauda alvinocaridis]THV57334.1 YceI family protein [Allomuricauda alvinocaridis]